MSFCVWQAINLCRRKRPRTSTPLKHWHILKSNFQQNIVNIYISALRPRLGVKEESQYKSRAPPNRSEALNQSVLRPGGYFTWISAPVELPLMPFCVATSVVLFPGLAESQVKVQPALALHCSESRAGPERARYRISPHWRISASSLVSERGRGAVFPSPALPASLNRHITALLWRCRSSGRSRKTSQCSLRSCVCRTFLNRTGPQVSSAER